MRDRLQLLTVKEIAAILGMNPRQVLRLISNGHLSTWTLSRVHRIKMQWLREYLVRNVRFH